MEGPQCFQQQEERQCVFDAAAVAAVPLPSFSFLSPLGVGNKHCASEQVLPPSYTELTSLTTKGSLPRCLGLSVGLATIAC